MVSPFHAAFEKLIPPLSSGTHKGQAGKMGVVGGSFAYTGAPYYASISALKAGADLAYVFCTKAAAVPIKSYSPELIVHPVLHSLDEGDDATDADAILESMHDTLEKLSAVIVGPGLGKDPLVWECVGRLIELCRAKGLPLIIDGDGLSLVTSKLDLVKGYDKAILTPNVAEFDRLWKAVFRDEERNEVDKGELEQRKTAAVDAHADVVRDLSRLAETLGNVTILRKGPCDLVSDGKTAFLCNEKGSLRRSGGQGDVLSGLVGTLFGWGVSMASDSSAVRDAVQGSGLSIATACAASAACLARHCGRAAFEKHHRATTTPDVIAEIGPTFHSLFAGASKL